MCATYQLDWMPACKRDRARATMSELALELTCVYKLQELCNRCLKYNKSCSKAWELLGSIAEREQAYKDAANSYEHAWKLAAEANSALGYKLAFNYMKAGRLVDAVTVAQAVLKVDPQYPKIKQDVLDKAWLGLKP